MKFIIEHEMLHPSIRWILRWGQRILLLTGTLALCYVGLSLLDATFYQVSAKRFLDRQIHLEKEHPDPQPRPMAKTGDILGRMDIPRLGISVAVLQGTSPRMLRRGAGHIL